MKHAILIMAHKNLNQLKRLISAVKSENIDVFVHIDSKQQLTKQEMADIESIGGIVIEKRIHGELDKWSLPQIAINLMNTAKNAGGVQVLLPFKRAGLPN